MHRLAWVLALSIAAGCYDSHAVFGVRPDGGGPAEEAGPFPIDAGRFDAGRFDGGRFDAGLFDGGRFDAGRFDAGLFDAGRFDAGLFDAGRRDAGRRDAGRPDAGRPRSTALRFERSDLVVVADDPTLDLTGAHTLEMWIRPRPSGGDGAIAIKGNRAMGQFALSIALVGDDVVAGWGTETGARHELSAPIVRGRWTHVAMVISPRTRAGGDDLLVVIDGSVAAAATFPFGLADAVNDAPLLFGQGYTGDIDEIRLWRIARDPVDIATTMHTRVPSGLAGLIAYWPLEERGQLAIDHTLTGHDGVLGNLTVPDGADPAWIADGAI